jgi:pimeloyl-ACP methyl ester carboxylesterase
MGSSVGAAFAVSFAVKHPDRAKSLVLLCPQLHRWDHKRWLADLLALITVLRDLNLGESGGEGEYALLESVVFSRDPAHAIIAGAPKQTMTGWSIVPTKPPRQTIAASARNGVRGHLDDSVLEPDLLSVLNSMDESLDLIASDLLQLDPCLPNVP